MKIYISHSRDFDFTNELYSPLRDSGLNSLHEIILPHESSSEPYNIKELIQNKSIDLIIAEVSFPTTGQGIELGWANIYEIPIICIYKTGSKISGSLKVVCDKFIEYSDSRNLIDKLSEMVK